MAQKVLDSLFMTHLKNITKKTQLAPGQLKIEKKGKKRISTNYGKTRSHANNSLKPKQIPK